MRRPLFWEMLKQMEVLTYLLLLRVSELFPEDDGSVHAVYDLRGGDVAFYEGERQVEEGSNPKVDTVEVRFGGSKVINVEEGRYW